MICPNCTHNNDENARFCTACGHPQQVCDTAPPTEQVASPAEQVVPPVTEETAPSVEQAVTPEQNGASPAPTSIPYIPPYSMQQGEEPVSLLKWLGIMALEVLCGIAHFVLMIVWAFSSKTDKSLKNYARAKLIMTVISLVLVAIIVLIILGFSTALVGVFSENVFPDDNSYYSDEYYYDEYFGEDFFGGEDYSGNDNFFYDEFSSWS